MKLIDLTHPFKLPMPVYPGDPEPELLTIASINQEGYLDEQLTTGLHVGTHIDAPAHMIPGGKLLSDYPLERFVGRGVLVDARGKSSITADVLHTVELASGDIVLVMTGWSRWYRTLGSVILDRKVASATAPDQGSSSNHPNTWIPGQARDDKAKREYFTNFPVVEESFAERLIEAQVSMLCLDTPSPDEVTGDPEDLFPIHRALLGADVLIAENLNQLDQLANVTSFDVIALPLRLAANGSPARIVASIQ